MVSTLTWTTPQQIVLNNQSPINFQLPDASRPSGSSNHLQERYQTPYSVRTASVRQQESSPCSLGSVFSFLPLTRPSLTFFWGVSSGAPLLFLSPQANLPPGWLQSHSRPWLHDPCHSYLLIVTFDTGTWAPSKQEVLSRITLFPVAVAVANIRSVFKLIQANWTFPVLRRLRWSISFFLHSTKTRITEIETNSLLATCFSTIQPAKYNV